MFRTKYKRDVTVDCREAHLVAKIFFLRPRADFNETFALL